ncbi:MAG: FAD-dependent oxidoreductase [Trichodesmium sp. St16_bin4-tuft]|nr:FAD-dependent oxidoreductase [Trichodesmium sp. St5_bin8]MDE5078884.1 FAD-dependent oxidoreductase [Trichodesmium sp. St2_bin6]MDE5091595.1 FAD-dependent oxidoreductase [Trichodesmium sp. St18_bin3_1_1]MDE5100734.1 FAD-dependent oxidoreductase [Trichodesmium sp. St16_bin4-tuft]
MPIKTNPIASLILSLFSLAPAITPTLAALPSTPDKEETCEILVIGGGLAGAATAYEALLAGRTVCITEITDWVGGQISSQGTSALDERGTQRSLLFYPRGYLELRERIKEKYGRLNPGNCWVSVSCFMPYDGHAILFQMLENAAKKGGGTLKWFPNTVIKQLDISQNQINKAIAIQHQPADDTPPINIEPLSQIIEDAYLYENSARFDKTIIQFVPQPSSEKTGGADWYVVEATETGEIIALADVPYRLGIDPQTYVNPSSPIDTTDPYCTQGFTYTFAMEATKTPQAHVKPPFYSQYSPYYSYELSRLANFNLVFSYRQIWSMKPDAPQPGNYRKRTIYPGDISMQNWTWGNDYRPGNKDDNLIYSRGQLQATGQLQPGGWMGGLRTEALRRGEENALGYFYWLVEGTTDSQLGEGVKQKYPNYRLLSGFDTPMGTAHGLSKYPYIREGRRIIGRIGKTHPKGFTVVEVDIAKKNFRDDFYQKNLRSDEFNYLWGIVGGFVPKNSKINSVEKIPQRARATVFPDSVGIGHYAIDFHPCMTKSPPEVPNNSERKNIRKGQGATYPFQIPLRAMIPQRINNLLIAGKSIATSYIAAAAYRVHSFEWSVGAAAGTTIDFALERGIFPYELIDDMPSKEWELEILQGHLNKNGNHTAFPETSIFNNSWNEWK